MQDKLYCFYTENSHLLHHEESEKRVGYLICAKKKQGKLYCKYLN